MLKVKVKTGEKFTFRVHVTTKSGEYRKLEAKLTSGEPLPTFLLLDLKVTERRIRQRKQWSFMVYPVFATLGV